MAMVPATSRAQDFFTSNTEQRYATILIYSPINLTVSIQSFPHHNISLIYLPIHLLPSKNPILLLILLIT